MRPVDLARVKALVIIALDAHKVLRDEVGQRHGGRLRYGIRVDLDGTSERTRKGDLRGQDSPGVHERLVHDGVSRNRHLWSSSSGFQGTVESTSGLPETNTLRAVRRGRVHGIGPEGGRTEPEKQATHLTKLSLGADHPSARSTGCAASRSARLLSTPGPCARRA